MEPEPHAPQSNDIDVDTFLYANPTSVVIFAAGNNGAYGTPGAVGSSALSKSALTLGASEDGRYPTQLQGKTSAGSVVFFSATGLAPDDRIEPDLVAPCYSTVRRIEPDLVAPGYSTVRPRELRVSLVLPQRSFSRPPAPPPTRSTNTSAGA
jgi:hypothetical protein